MSPKTATGRSPSTSPAAAGTGSATSGGPGRSRRVPLVVLLVAVAALIGSIASVPWLSDHGRSGSLPPVGVPGPGPAGPRSGMTGGGVTAGGMMGGAGSGMMAGRVLLAGDGAQVASIAAARARAAQAAQTTGLHPGEVIWFANGFYVELKDAAGDATTEVIVDPGSGAVSTEPGPAMMWNTGSRTATLSQAQASAMATQWLATERPGETVGAVDAYPGYYSVDTQVGGVTAGMLSVNAGTGQVWYHSWHGAFVAKEDS